MWMWLAACEDGKESAETGVETGESADTDDTNTIPTYNPACLDADAKAVLSAHVGVLQVLSGTHPLEASEEVTTPLYQWPGVDVNRDYNISLFWPCEEPAEYDPQYVDGLVYVVECLGKGAWWTVHAENDGDTEGVSVFDGWRVEGGRTAVTWSEQPSIGVTWEIGRLTGPDGRDWTLNDGGTAAATMDGQLDYEAGFDTIHPEGPLQVSMLDGAGVLRVDGIDIAAWDGDSFEDAACRPPD